MQSMAPGISVAKTWNGFKKTGVLFAVSLVLSLSCRASMDIRNGELLANSQLELESSGEGGYRIGRGRGSVIKIEAQSQGSFFRTDHRYVEELLIGLPDYPPKIAEMILPGKDIRVLYQAGTQFVVFKSSVVEGRLIVDEVDEKNKRVKGMMHLKLKNELAGKGFEKEMQLDFRFILKIMDQ